MLADFAYIFRSQAEGIHCSNVDRCSSTPGSDKQNPPYRALDLPFFFRYNHITSLKKPFSPAPSESLPYWLQGNFAAMFVLNYWLKEFSLCEFANRLELRCEPMQLKHRLQIFKELGVKFNDLFL